MKIDIPDWLWNKFRKFYKENWGEEPIERDLVKVLEEESNYW